MTTLARTTETQTWAGIHMRRTTITYAGHTLWRSAWRLVTP